MKDIFSETDTIEIWKGRSRIVDSENWFRLAALKFDDCLITQTKALDGVLVPF